MATEEDTAVLAGRVLERFGEGNAETTRPGIGESNHVWMTPTTVLRMSAAPGPNLYLERELALIPHLPAEVGYPQLVSSGSEEGHFWILTDRLPGENLQLAWADLTPGQRLCALEDLWARLAALQRTDPNVVRSIGAVHCPMYALQPAGATALLDRLVGASLVDSELHRRLLAVLADLFELMAQVPWRLNHTDPGAHNAVFDGEHAVPVDFEFATLAPCDLDLDGLLVHLHRPEDHPVAEHLLRLGKEHVNRPGGRRRLTGYRILRRLWAVEVWHRHALARNREGSDASWPPRDPRRWDPILELPDLVRNYTDSQEHE